MALKFFKRGAEYEGALQRERYVLERLSAPHHNLVSCVAHINYRGAHCLVMELLHLNIRQVSKRESVAISTASMYLYITLIVVTTFEEDPNRAWAPE